MSLISSEIQQRIITAAEQLHAEHPERLPTVAEVRAVSKADMNSVSTVMKQWRQNKLMPVQRIEEDAPNEIQVTAKELTGKIWSVAKEQAEQKLRDAEARYTEERIEAEQLRAELSDACDSLQQQLDKALEELEVAKSENLRKKKKKESIELELSRLGENLSQAKEAERLATSKNEEQAKHIDTLKNELNDVKNQLKTALSEFDALVDSHKSALFEQDNKISERDSVIDGLKAKLETLTQSNHEKDKALIELHGQLKVAEATATQAQHHAKDLKDLLDKQVKTAPVTKPRAKKDVSQNKDNNNE